MRPGLLFRLRRRGVLRVAASYALIAWLALQVADVTFDPLGVPGWVMTALIVAAVLGFPVAVALAWFYEIDDDGVHRDIAAEAAERPIVHGKRRFADLAIIGALLVTVAILLVRQSDLGKPRPPDDPAIAVLPFENLSGDPGQEYFSDGLAEEVLGRLGRVPGLKVIASSSSFSFKGGHQDAKTIASKLGVTTLLEGSVRRDGRKLRVNAKLVDGRTGYQIWSGSFDRETTDIFDVQAELAAAVIEAIVPAARGDTAPAPTPTTSLDAHDHYLLGIAAQRARTPSRLAESVAHLERAVALDPSYAQAHAALANSRLLHAGYSGQLRPGQGAEILASAERSAYQALALDSSLSDAHGALGNVLRISQRPGAEDAYRHALELNPNNAIVAHNYGVLLGDIAGRERDAAEMSDLALELDPRSAIVWTNKLTRIRESQGVAEFREQLARALQIFADDADGLATLGLVATSDMPLEAMQLARAIEAAGGDRSSALLSSLPPLIALGQYDEAIARAYELKATEGIDLSGIRPHLILALGLKGDFDRLNEVFADPTPSPVAKHYRYAVKAFWCVVQDRSQEAAEALETAGHVEEGGGWPMGSSMERGAVPALMRLYDTQGRQREARELAARFREFLKTPRRAWASPSTDQVLLAGVAAAGGERAEAVRHLQEAMKAAPVPEFFYPQLPWFRSLEGEPGYAELVEELERRRASILAELASGEQAASTR